MNQGSPYCQDDPGNNRSEFVRNLEIALVRFKLDRPIPYFWNFPVLVVLSGFDPWIPGADSTGFYLMWFDKSCTKRWFSNSINDWIRMIFSFFFFFNRTRKSNHTYIITVVNDYYVIPFTKYFWFFWGREWIRVGFWKCEIWVGLFCGFSLSGS